MTEKDYRDWFAGQALVSVIKVCANDTRGPGCSHAEHFARKAYEIADAMMKERAKQ